MAGKLDGGKAVQSGTITTTQLVTSLSDSISAGSGPKIKSLIYPGDDTAANTVGGQTVYITGSGFASNVAVYVNGAAVPSVSYISASNVGFTTPALSSSTYPVYVINPETGATAIAVPGLIVSGEPTWSTAAGSLNSSQDSESAWSYSLSATGDAPITYALAAGSSLPSGISLASNGAISGTLSSPPASETTYTFSVVATDAQNQDSTRQFTVTASVSDPYFNYTTLLLHADGTNNGNNHAFLDSSNNNLAITRNGNSTQGTFTPFSLTGWSNYFDGNGDYLNFAGNSAFSIATSTTPFTIECWVYPTAAAGGVIFSEQYTGAGNPISITITMSDGTSVDNPAGQTIAFGWYTGSAWVGAAIANTTVSLNAWTHVACVFTGSTTKIYLNGVDSTKSSTPTPATTWGVTGNNGDGWYIGRRWDTASNPYFTGYISNLRFVNGSAVYTGNFTPSTTPLTAITNTSLLTCQSNRFVDNSTNAFTLTRNGDTKVLPFSPLTPTAAYATANVGGSVYLDGTGDYLSVAHNTALNLSSGDFTVEGWFYCTGLTADYQQILNKDGVYNSTYQQYGCSISSSGKFVVGLGNGAGASPTQTDYDATTTVPLNSWNHFAFVRTGSTIKVFFNGTQTVSTAQVTAMSDGGKALLIGYQTGHPSGQYFNGYISNIRILKGTALYTSSFTVPTVPLTNIANTSLLLNMTNAQIIDQTSKNILETVGDAKVSTTQYKYGSASMYFDGTGDWLIIPRSNLFDFGAGNFTIEGWINVPTSDATYRTIFSIGYPVQIYQRSNNIEAYFNDSDDTQTYVVNPAAGPSNSVTTNTWTHFAVVRNGTTFTVYVNGVAGTAVTGISAAVAYSATGPYIGTFGPATTSYPFTGYIDDLRITKGYARYTSNFTAPTSAFKDR